jgi:hypothetical protein
MTYDSLREEVRSAASEMTIDTVGRAIVGALTEAELNLLIEAIAYHKNKLP